jgi:uncharacterized protein (TIGR02001 family)
MKTKFLAGLVSGLALASAASAEGLNIYAGATLTSNYLFTGITQTANNPTVQGYVEGEVGGFYFGVWGSGVTFPPDSVEIDPYFGYRGEAGLLSYDASFTHVRYDSTGFWSNNIALELGVAVSDLVTLSVRDSYDLTNSFNQISLKGEVAATDTLSLWGIVGRDGGLGGTWLEVGAGYSVNDTVSVALVAQKNQFAPALFAASISFDTQIFGN